MKIDRRGIFALGGLGAIGAGTGALGAEYRLFGGLTITIQRMRDGWGVAVPDWEAMGGEFHKVGMTPAIKIMPIAEFLAELDRMDAVQVSTNVAP